MDPRCGVMAGLYNAMDICPERPNSASDENGD